MPTFTPPTQPESMPGHPLTSRYSIEVGQSVVKKNGRYILMPYPWLGDIQGLIEGVDWFNGGRTYTITDAIATALAADGYATGPDLEEDQQGGDPPPHFFAKADNARLNGLVVFQQSPPPASDATDSTYSYWPVTDSSTSQNFATSTWTGGRRWSFTWANRVNFGSAWNKKPNVLPAPAVNTNGHQCRSVFTTVDRANAATQSQIRHMLGNDEASYQAPWLAVGGTAADFITEAAWRADPATACPDTFISGSTTYSVMTDKVLLPTPRFVDGNRPDLAVGVVLDYEVQDSRTPTQSQDFILAVANDCHTAGKQLFLYTNPLNATTQQYTGLNASNLPPILAAVDLISIFLWSQSVEGSIPSSYSNQVALLGGLGVGDWDKLVINFELGNPGTTLADAAWVAAKLREGGFTHPSKVMFWRDFAVQGEAGNTTTNQKIATVCGL